MGICWRWPWGHWRGVALNYHVVKHSVKRRLSAVTLADLRRGYECVLIVRVCLSFLVPRVECHLQVTEKR